MVATYIAASLVDLEKVDVGQRKAVTGKGFRDRLDGRQSGERGVDADRRPRPDGGQRRQPQAIARNRQRRRSIVGTAGIARGDREPFDLGVKRLERGQLLDAGVAAGMLVSLEQSVRGLDRDDLVLEPALVDRLDRLAV